MILSVSKRAPGRLKRANKGYMLEVPEDYSLSLVEGTFLLHRHTLG
jgi:hypothetical protein